MTGTTNVHGDTTEPRGGVQAVHRALDILEIVARTDVVGVTSAAEQLGLSVSTVHGLMRTLATRHYLLRVPGGYRMGPASAVLGSQWRASRVLTPVIEPVLERLSAATGLATTATVLEGREAHLIAATEGAGPVSVRINREDWRDPLTLATGRLLVSYTSKHSWRSFLESATPDSVQRWEQELSRMRSRSVAVKLTADPREAVSMAVPVLGAGDVVSCAIGCFCPAFLAGDLFNDDVLEHLWLAASDASKALGGNAPRRPTLDFTSLTSALPKAMVTAR
ncbi:IclR family transcriptional regulator [Microbacterium sp. NPDC055903]